jgi:hypothetical protein
MCFSANASFITGTVLTVIGGVGIKKNKVKRYIPFATIPLLFGIQQFAEGFLWLNLHTFHLPEIEMLSTFTFLIFAQVIWPTWIPLSFLLLDDPANRSKLQYLLVYIGALLSMYLLYCLFNYDIDAVIENKHIKYVNNYPNGVKVFGLPLYAITTILPLFSTHIPKLWFFGVAICASLLLTVLIYSHYLTSVWCYFAAIISFVILLILSELNAKSTLITQSGLKQN